MKTEYWLSVLEESTEDQWALRQQEFLDEAQYQKLVKFLGRLTSPGLDSELAPEELNG